MATSIRPVALISGISDGFGASLAKLFAARGYDILGLSRSERAARRIGELADQGGGNLIQIPCDLTEPGQVAIALQPHVERISVFIHNAHALTMKPIVTTTLEEFERAWRVICYGAMVISKIVVPSMIAHGSGTIIFTGATAGLRGGAKFAAFASAKFALRGLAQSLARECGPSGVHVAHVVLDGLIDEPQSDARFGPAKSMRIDPDAIAKAYLDLVRQHPSAWTHELDLRPCDEQF